MASQNEIEKTLEYIQERSRSIQRVSEKLERELWRLQRVFDTEYYCRICFQSRDLYTNNVIDNSEKAKMWINKTVKHDEFLFNPEVQDILIIKPHKFVPAIEVAIDVVDKEPFYRIDDGDLIEYYLCFNDRKIAVIKKVNGEDSAYFWIYKATRELELEGIKAMLQRLPEFLRHAASVLQNEEEKRKELLSIAEKVNAAIAL